MWELALGPRRIAVLSFKPAVKLRICFMLAGGSVSQVEQAFSEIDQQELVVAW